MTVPNRPTGHDERNAVTETDDRIAVIGMAVRIPGAEDTVDLRWMLSRDTVEVDEVPPSRWARDLYLGESGHQGTHHRGAFLQDPFSFDHEAFGMTAEDAVLLDPQQRLMLEVGARALEDAGYLLPGHRTDAGVFIGARMNSYGFDHGRGLSVPGAAAGHPVPAALWGRSQNFVAAWLSDRFDLAGPSLAVDTACSSSLTAVWLACQSLAAGACRMAVVGAVDLLIDPLTFVLLSRTGALSPDGLCQTFDEKANGYVPGEGAAALVLKPMAAAVADNDLILGAITRTAVNNDGSTMGVTTPSLQAQTELLTKVYGRTDPTTVQYIEAHGTGTAIGDPIEVQALSEVFGGLGAGHGSVALGSLKRRIGHLHSASGLAGLAKVISCLRDGLLPGTPVDALNPRLRLDASPFRVPEAPAPWPEVPVRRAGVSGFGFGGTNAHVVAEAVPDREAGRPDSPRRPAEILALSAGSPDALRELAAQWLEFLPSVADGPGSVCATARLARPHRPARVAVCGRDTGELAAALRARLLRAQDPAFDPPAAGPARPARVTVRVDPADGHAPPPWLPALSRSVPAVGRITDRFEEATGTPVAEFSGELLRICSAVALTVALRETGLPEGAVGLPPGWEPLADFAGGHASLEEALAAVLGGADALEGAEPADRAAEAGETDLCARLAEAADEQAVATVLAEVAAAAYESGENIDWNAFQAGTPWSKRLLPWAQPRGRALDLREPLRSPEPGGPVVIDSDPGEAGYTFSRIFGPGEEAIAQHSVYRRIMLPGVAWFDFLRQGAEARGDSFHGVRDVLFHRPLIPSGAERVVCRVEGDGRFTVTDGTSGTPFVTGSYLTGGPGAAPDPEPVPELLASCGPLHAGSGLYRWLRRIGYHHGRYYRNISWVAGLPGGGTLARIEGGRQRAMNDPGVRLFPGLLDSVTIAAIDPDNPVFGADDASAFIPLSVDRVQVLGPLDNAAWVRTHVAFWNEEACRVTQVVTDPRGEVLLVLGDIASKRVPVHAFGGPGATGAAPRPGAPAPASRAPEPEPARTPSPPGPVPPQPASGPPPESRAPRTTTAPGSAAGRVLAWFLAQAEVSEEHCDTEFLSAGFDSVGLVALSDRLAQEHGLTLYPTVFFEYPTPRRFADHLVQEFPGFASGVTAPAPGQPGPPAPEPVDPAPGQTARTGAPAPSGTSPDEDTAPCPEPVTEEAEPAAGPVLPTATAVPRPARHRTDAPEGQPDDTRDGSRDIAVVGAAIRVPTAHTLEDFWSLLIEGRDTVGPLPPGRWRGTEGQVPHASFLESVDEFDPAPFRISAREAPLIDPQARIVYETIWEALEDAGRMGERHDERTGLWIAYSHDHYHEERSRHGVGSGRGLGLEAMIPNRLSHLMDWHGPSLVINTLCSSSLVAVHTALQHLRAGDIDTAVIGGVHAAISPEYFASMQELMALSPRHRCRAFDASADGFVPGEGAAAIVLRRREDALEDGDRIRGLIKGAAVNHGGRTTRYSAPSPRAQSEVISAALRDAAVHPD
ncbi:beta-ketoacyl synthase N-terminal-like domain-containing protein, partial [Streptomyces sodiiphilus]|uniref:beta-ketoacyl synthase N-terminal-like domain-containing protein n=1 Tax=Streptomyces sodiiphilus TaxID=226217 RepID=UPI0031DECFF6